MDNDSENKVIALEARLKECSNVITLGVKTNFLDYTKKDAALIRKAKKIYYPTTFYAELFDTIGKKTFPSYHTYKFVQDKIKQTALFNILSIPHPNTRVFYGKRRHAKALEMFKFPFIAKVPRGSAMGRGVYLINNPDDLTAYYNISKIAYIQEYMPVDRDIRIVVIGNKAVHAYWRIVPANEYRSNVAVGGKVSLAPVPQKAVELALNTAKLCGWDDVGIDIINFKGEFYVLEANMKYGKEGFRMAGINYKMMMENMIKNGEI